MKRPKTHPKTGQPLVPVGYIRGKAVWPILGASPDDPSAGDPGAGGGSGTGSEPNKETGAEKTFTQADLSRVATREKAEGKVAAERAIAEQFGCTIEEAKAIITKAREAEDRTKSEVEKEREKAKAEREAAEADRKAAAKEIHAARIERALGSLGFTGDEAASKRVHGMVTVEVGGSYDDVLVDVKELQKTLNPELFGGKTPDGKKKPPGRIPNSDPAGTPPPPNGGDDAYAAGQKRFEERKKARVGYNPFAKQT